MVVLLQTMLDLEALRNSRELPVRIEGRVDRVACRMNLVDCDVDVPVVCIAMHGAHALVISVAQAPTNLILDRAQHLIGRLLLRAERNDQVIGLVIRRTCIAALNRLDLCKGILQHFAVAIGDRHPSDAHGVLLCVGHVANQVQKAAFSDRPHGDVFDDQVRAPISAAKFFTRARAFS